MVDTLHPPYSVIATWPKPNYINPETQGPALVYVCILLAVLGVLIVGARIYSRVVITRAPGADDALIVIALGFGIVLSVLVIIGNRTWWSGHHIWDIPISKFAGHRLNIWFAEWCYVISTSATKISILLFYRRISVKFSKKFVIATWIGIVYNILYMVAFCLVLVLLCRPVNAYWDSFNPVWALKNSNHHCGKENVELPLSGVFSVVGDFYSAILPMWAIFSLDLPPRQKFSLYALFSLAFLIVAAGIARTVLMHEMMNVDYDFTWVLWEMWMWGMVELYVAILAASAPALKPFLRKFFLEPLSTAAAIAGSRRGIIRPQQSFHKSGHSRRSRRSYLASQNSKGDFSTSKSYVSVRESALIDDPENIGIAYGGVDSLKTREESFAREADDDALETRRYELAHGKEGRIVVVQVWNARPHLPRPTSISTHLTNTFTQNPNIRVSHVPVNRPVSVPIPLSVATSTHHHPLPQFPVQGQLATHVRNFSLPYPSTAPATPTGESGPRRQSWRLPHLQLQAQLGAIRAARRFEMQQVCSV